MHNYERTCSIYKNECKAFPRKDENGIDAYDHNNYSAPVQAIISIGGFSFDEFSDDHASRSLQRLNILHNVSVTVLANKPLNQSLLNKNKKSKGELETNKPTLWRDPCNIKMWFLSLSFLSLHTN